MLIHQIVHEAKLVSDVDVGPFPTGIVFGLMS